MSVPEAWMYTKYTAPILNSWGWYGFLGVGVSYVALMSMGIARIDAFGILLSFTCFNTVLMGISNYKRQKRNQPFWDVLLDADDERAIVYAYSLYLGDLDKIKMNGLSLSAEERDSLIVRLLILSHPFWSTNSTTNNTEKTDENHTADGSNNCTLLPYWDGQSQPA